MVTKPNAMALYRKLCAAPDGFLASPQGKAMAAKAVALVRQTEGDSEANTLQNLLDVAALTDKVFGA